MGNKNLPEKISEDMHRMATREATEAAKEKQ